MTKAPTPVDAGPFKLSFQPPVFESVADERLHRKQRLAAAFRLFSKFGFDEGVAGHITVRDPEHTDTFWVNPFGIHFSQINVSNLIRVNHDGETIEGTFPVNTAAYAIHSRIHKARPDVVAAAHSHSLHGKAFSTLGKLLDPLTQDACAFYQDHAVYDDFGGVVVDLDEGARIARALGDKKAAILQNHGLLTVGSTIDAAVWWFITMERSCQAELLARAAGEPKLIRHEAASQAAFLTGNPIAGWFQFQPLYARIVKEQPDLLE
ncbi:MAG: class II aldolase/adducin family protein [Polyangiaceae bacterium]